MMLCAAGFPIADGPCAECGAGFGELCRRMGEKLTAKGECVKLNISKGITIGILNAYDSHGTGRRNKAWVGTIKDENVDLPNLKAVDTWAKERGYSVTKLY